MDLISKFLFFRMKLEEEKKKQREKEEKLKLNAKIEESKKKQEYRDEVRTLNDQRDQFKRDMIRNKLRYINHFNKLVRQDEERLQEIQNKREMEIMKENEIKNLKRLDRMNAAEIEQRKQDYQREQVLERIMAEDLKYRYYFYNNYNKTSIRVSK